MMFSGPVLMVSLPGAELAAIDPQASVVPPHTVTMAPISPELRSALRLVVDAGRRHGVEINCVARPECFVNDISREWLRQWTATATQHLCLSDGGAIKTLTGLRTHVFFYRRGFRDSLLAQRCLSRRAPECLASVRGQVNSHLVLGEGPARARPPPLFLGATTPAAPPDSDLFPFYFNRHSVEDTAGRIARAGPIAPEAFGTATVGMATGGMAALRYVPLTDVALGDRDFARAVAAMVLASCLDPQRLLVLRLPPDQGEGLPGSIAAILPGLRDCGLVIPRAWPPNILFAAGDLAENHALFERFPRRLVVHESFDFWRHTEGFYAKAQRVTVLTGADPFANDGFLPYDVSQIYGPRAVRRGIAGGIGGANGGNRPA